MQENENETESGWHSSGLMAILWSNNNHKVMNVHTPPEEGNFCDEQGRSVKSLVEVL
jgi:hypothetical protein